MSSQMNFDDLKPDINNLYREESITDMKVANIRRMTPITPDGEIDPARESLFVASTTIMTGAGPMPINADLEAKTLTDAMEEFPTAVEKAVNEMIERAREMQREQANKIVVPDAGTASQIQIP